MGKIVNIDPVSRIEGHLRVDVEVDNGKIVDAWSVGTMFRGIEQILVGKDPGEAWIFAQRFCGVCTTVHAIGSVRAVENALGMEIPLNAQMIRNMIIAAHSIFDHISHFYHLSALDWVDVVSASRADPAKAAKTAQSFSSWTGNTTAQFRGVKEKLTGILKSGQPGIFANGYWGHDAMNLSPELNLMAVSHYLDALEYQRKINEVVGLLGSKTPHIQNLAVGGVANAIDMDEETALNMTSLLKVKSYFEAVRDFVNNAYLTDVCAVMSQYMPWTEYGKGVDDYLSVPEFPTDTRGNEFEMKGGTVIDGAVKEIASFHDSYFEDNVSESIDRSWYEGSWDKHPYKQTTEPAYAHFDRNGKYTWVKSPRFMGRRMQVGPTAQILSAHMLNDPLTMKHVKMFLSNVNTIGAATGVRSAATLQMDGLVSALPSTLGRHAARVIRCAAVLDMALAHWDRLVENIGKGDLSVYNKPGYPEGEITGFSMHEAPRGALSHWVVIENGILTNYQAVVPSTWNFSPKTIDNKPGPCEASLIGNPIADEKRPLEALRTVHSYDPCLACAIHAFNPEGNSVGVANARV